MRSTYSEDELIEQPALKLFSDLHWKTANCFDEVFGLGRDESTTRLYLGARREPAVQDREPVIEPLFQACRERRSQRDLGNENDRLASPPHCFAHDLDVDLGFSAPRDSLEEKRGELPEGPANAFDRLALFVRVVELPERRRLHPAEEAVEGVSPCPRFDRDDAFLVKGGD